jgi:hypothetical protein
MSREIPYSKLLSVAVTLFIFVLLAGPLEAQMRINGVPASVTSFGFGGSFGPQGVPASVTSLGFGQVRIHRPFFGPRSPFFRQPTCCINPLFPRRSRAPFFHNLHNRFPGGDSVVAVPYYYPVVVEPVDDTMESVYGPGPTIFDRRGSDRGSVGYGPDYDERLSKLEKQLDEAESKAKPKEPAAVEEMPAKEQPATILVYRDGHSIEVRNYAIVGNTLFDFSTDHRKKIALADLDLTATQKQNEDRGVDFRVPAGHSGS